MSETRVPSNVAELARHIASRPHAEEVTAVIRAFAMKPDNELRELNALAERLLVEQEAQR